MRKVYRRDKPLLGQQVLLNQQAKPRALGNESICYTGRMMIWVKRLVLLAVGFPGVLIGGYFTVIFGYLLVAPADLTRSEALTLWLLAGQLPFAVGWLCTPLSR